MLRKTRPETINNVESIAIGSHHINGSQSHLPCDIGNEISELYHYCLSQTTQSPFGEYTQISCSSKLNPHRKYNDKLTDYGEIILADLSINMGRLAYDNRNTRQNHRDISLSAGGHSQNK